MCVQDVRMGRALVANQRTSATPTVAAPVRVLTADPNRGRVVASMFGYTTTNGNSGLVLRAGASDGPVIASLAPGYQTVCLRVEDFGSLITRDVWAVCTQDVAPPNQVDVSDLTWTIDPGDA